MAKPKKRVNEKVAPARPKKIWLVVLIYIALGYVLMNVAQAIFCGTKAVSVCKAGFWMIPAWLVIGIIYYFLKLKK